MINVVILKTDGQNADFIKLANLLDDDLNKRYGELQKLYEKHNNVTQLNNVVIVYHDRVPVACGALKEYDSNSVELKRIFVVDSQRGQGFAKLIVGKLEQIAESIGYKYAVLETGVKQYEAINLYKSCGYNTIPNYAPYTENTNSVCMKKQL